MLPFTFGTGPRGHLGREFNGDDEEHDIPVTTGPTRIYNIEKTYLSEAVLLETDVIEPDITSLLLIQAGDIETNPGPQDEYEDTCGKCEKKFRKGSTPLECNFCHKLYHPTSCSGESRSSIEKLKSEGADEWNCMSCRTADTDTNQEPETLCGKCQKKFRKALPVKCVKCLQSFHKTSCTDESREVIDEIVKKKKHWTCKACRGITREEDTPQPQLPPEQETINEEPTNCGECGARFTGKITPMKCSTCSNSFHKTTCTGETRWRIEKMIKEKTPWSCKGCKNGTGPPLNHANKEHNHNQAEPGRCRENTCKKQIRRGTDFLICTKCEHHFHKQEKCSKMTRKQVETLKRDTWQCMGCQNVEANPRPPEDQEQESTYKIRRTKLNKLNILQYNIDSLSSKLEELKLLLKEENIDVFLIQETKLITTDKLPNVPGYTVLRQDRTQRIGNEDNRGGGLITGIRHDTPYKEVNLDIRKAPDKHTECMTVEIPIAPHKKLRLTNVYIPPSNTSTGNVDESSTSTENWPSKNHDLILGDFNAHSLLWDEYT